MVLSMYNSVQLVLHNQLYIVNYNTGHVEKQRREATKCCQAKQLLRQANLSLTEYALKLPRADLRILTGLLTGRANLNWHLVLM